LQDELPDLLKITAEKCKLKEIPCSELAKLEKLRILNLPHNKLSSLSKKTIQLGI